MLNLWLIDTILREKPCIIFKQITINKMSLITVGNFIKKFKENFYIVDKEHLWLAECLIYV